MIRLLVALIGPLLKVRPVPPSVPAGAHQVDVFRASARYLSYRYFTVALGWAPTLVAWMAVTLALAGGHQKMKVPLPGVVAGSAVVLMAVLLGLAIAVASVRLDYDFHCYVVTDRSVRIRRGIWEQIEATLTYANVQNVRVLQGPLERLFGISSVVVDTAGSSARSQSADPMLQHHKGVIRGIENAPEIRDRIMTLLRANRSAGLGDQDDHADHPPVDTETELLAQIRDETRGLAQDLRARPRG